MKNLTRRTGIIVAAVTVLALVGAGGAAAGAATIARANYVTGARAGPPRRPIRPPGLPVPQRLGAGPRSDASDQNLLNITGTVHYTQRYTPQGWNGGDTQTATFTITGYDTGKWEVKDNTDETKSGGGCTYNVMGSWSGSGTFNGDNYNSVELEYDPEISPAQYLDIAIGWDEDFTETVAGPPDKCGKGGTSTAFNDIEPQCYAQDTAPQLVGSAIGAFPDDAAVNFDCSGKNVIYMYDMIDSYTSSGKVNLACPAASEMGRRIACIAEVAANPWPLGSWDNGVVPYSWGGGHAPSPGPTLGTCDGYTGPHHKTIKDCEAYPKGPTHTVGLDCSGFTRWVYYLAYGQDVLGDGDNNAQRVHTGVTSVPSPSLGDLVFYGPADNTHHIGVYVGAALADPGNYIVNEYGTDYDVEYDLVNAPSLVGTEGKNPPQYYTYNNGS